MVTCVRMELSVTLLLVPVLLSPVPVHHVILDHSVKQVGIFTHWCLWLCIFTVIAGVCNLTQKTSNLIYLWLIIPSHLILVNPVFYLHTYLFCTLKCYWQYSVTSKKNCTVFLHHASRYVHAHSLCCSASIATVFF